MGELHIHVEKYINSEKTLQTAKNIKVSETNRKKQYEDDRPSKGD